MAETQFAFLGYSLSVQQTPARRELDYLRMLGASKESAKEQKLFGLGQFFVGRYQSISDELHHQNVELARTQAVFGSLLALLGTVGYYGTYAYGIYLTVTGALTLDLDIPRGRDCRRQHQHSGCVLDILAYCGPRPVPVPDLIEFFAVQPQDLLQAQCAARSAADSARI